MKLRYFPLIVVCLLLASGSSLMAQSAKLKRAKQYMQDLAYAPAITLLNQVLEKEDNADAKIAIAECYRKINDWENSEYWYAQVVKAANVNPLHKLYYGESLQRNGKCDLAKEWYQQYIQDKPDDQRGQYLVKACDYENELMTKNGDIFTLKHPNFNSNMDDFSPAFYKSGVVFASDRDKGSAIKRQHCWTGNPFLELYYVDAKNKGGKEELNFTYGHPEKFSSKLNTRYHEAAVSFGNDQKQIFFTRNNYFNGKIGKDDEGIVRLKIFSAKSKGSDTWGDLESLPFNSDEYSVAHPTVTSDGNKLYFVSDMPGGFGGFDLYVSDLENGKWSAPVNLGPKINTEGNELFPFYHSSGRLYFASDSQIGLGGLDIYYMDDNGKGEFGNVVNIGAPINSKGDDFGLVLNQDGKFGYFASDRTGGSGRDDIYSFKKLAAPVEILVFDEETKLPIANAMVVDSCSGTKYMTGADGKVRLEMKLDICCTFHASKETYSPNQMSGCTKDLGDINKLLVEIPLSKGANFELEGTIFDLGVGLPLDGATVTLTNDCGKTAPPPITTDATGKYKFKLEPNCCYKIKAEKQGYFAQTSEDKCTKGLKASTTLKADLNLQPISVGDQTKKPTDGSNTIDETGTNDPNNKDNKQNNGKKTNKDTAYNDGNGKKPNNKKSNKDTANNGKKSSKKGVNLDPNTGLYLDPDTGEPFTGTKNGKTYKDGKLIDKPSGTFDPSPAPLGEDGSLAYLLHIYYDFDQAYIRDEARPELEKLLKLMQDNPTYIIEIGSHTDSRGSNSYNSRLSQRRAESVVRWLIGKGVTRDRLVPRGYGENRMVNNCVNEVPCHEKEHQLNRRTEFRVLGCTGCVPNEKISRPKENPKVDPCHGCPF